MFEGVLKGLRKAPNLTTNSGNAAQRCHIQVATAWLAGEGGRKRSILQERATRRLDRQREAVVGSLEREREGGRDGGRGVQGQSLSLT